MTRPVFSHPVFDQLYTRDYFIADEVLRDILALGPEVAVPELLKITEATLTSFDYNDPVAADWSVSYYFLHALNLLHELRAPEAFDVYRHLLRLDPEITEYWFGDGLTEELPDILAEVGQPRLPELLAMLEDPAIALQHRIVVSGAVARLARTQPELRPAISAFLQQYLRHIIAHADQATQLFPPDAGTYGYELDTYLGFLLTDIQEANLRELEPEIRQLHRLGLVDETIAGGEADLNFERGRALPPVPDIFARYQQWRDLPDNYSPFHPDAAAIAQRRAEQETKYAQIRRENAARQLLRRLPQPQPAAPKVGRNDPCLCGSGKKYKKCHGA